MVRLVAARVEAEAIDPEVLGRFPIVDRPDDLADAAHRRDLVRHLAAVAVWSRAAGAAPSTWTSGKPAKPCGQVPVAVAQQLHRGRYENEADEGCVEQQGDGDSETHLLEHHEVAAGEAAEDGDDDEGGAGDDAPGRADAVDDGGMVVAGLPEALADAAEQEERLSDLLCVRPS